VVGNHPFAERFYGVVALGILLSQFSHGDSIVPPLEAFFMKMWSFELSEELLAAGVSCARGDSGKAKCATIGEEHKTAK